MPDETAEFEGPGDRLEATIEHTDGSRDVINVGPEDLITNEEGDVVGVVNADATKGDTLADVEYIVTPGK